MIGPVSFRASEGFSRMISKPQTYTTTPQAAAGLSKGEGKKHKAGKFILTIAAIAAALGGLTYAAAKGKLNPVEDGNKIIENIKKVLKPIGDKTYKLFTTIAQRVDQVNKAVPNAAPDPIDLGEAAADIAKKAADGVV